MQFNVEQTLDDFVLQVMADIPLDTGVIGVFGDSGQGKSSLLRAMAGLSNKGQYRIVNSTLALQYGAKVNCADVRAEYNPCVLNRQKTLLFPHLTVAQNLDFVVKHAAWRQSPSRSNKVLDSRNIQVQDVIHWFKLPDLLDKPVSVLSGGEQQRVAIARSLLTGKPIVLLDEPFSALDWPTRLSCLSLLNDIAKHYQMCFVMVSHSLKELSLVCDHMLHLHGGQVLRQGDTSNVIRAINQTTDVAPFAQLSVRLLRNLPEYQLSQWCLAEDESQSIYIKQGNAYAGVISEGFGNLQTAGTEAKPLSLQQSNVTEQRIIIDAEQISIARDFNSDTSMLNQLKAKVVAITQHQHMVVVTLAVGQQQLLAQISNLSLQRLNLAPNDLVYAQFKAL